ARRITRLRPSSTRRCKAELPYAAIGLVTIGWFPSALAACDIICSFILLYCKKHYKLYILRWRFVMPRSVERKEHPLSMRLPKADIAVIDRAAALRGRSRTDFVRDAAVRAAEEVLMETAPIRMSPAGFKA